MVVDSLIIEQAKIGAHPLNPDHPDGWSKARFFLGRGFSLSAPDGLATALALHATPFWPGRIVSNSDVAKPIVVGSLIRPDATGPEIAAIWNFEPGATAAPRSGPRYPTRRNVK